MYSPNLLRFMIPLFRPACFLLASALAVVGPVSSSSLAGDGESQVLRLSLREAIRMAVAKNFVIESEALSPLIASARVQSQLGRFDPNLEVRGSRTERTTRFGPDAGNRLVTDVDDYFAGITGTTPLGTDYEIGAGATYREDAPNDENWATGLRLGVRQPLLRDFGPAANLAGLRLARADAEGSEWQYRQRVIDVITQTFFVYNEIYFANENLRAAERSRDLARQLLSDNEKRADIGVMSPLDVTSARAEAAAREEGVILARRQVRDNENFLKQLITKDTLSLLDVRIEIEPPPPPATDNVEIGPGIRDALALRPDFQQAQLELRRRHINLAFSKNQALPRFDLTGSLDLNGLGGDFGGTFSDFGRNDRTWSAGGVFSMPIPNRTARGNLDAARLAVRQALIELQRLEQEIIVRVDNAAGQVTTGLERIRSTAQSLELATESLRAGQERLGAGSGTTFEVLELQQRLAAAEAAAIRARSDLNNAVSEFQRQTGTTLRAHAIELTR
jgi:outer membrane protein